jgi:hypothetical protein
MIKKKLICESTGKYDKKKLICESTGKYDKKIDMWIYW